MFVVVVGAMAVVSLSVAALAGMAAGSGLGQLSVAEVWVAVVGDAWAISSSAKSAMSVGRRSREGSCRMQNAHLARSDLYRGAAVTRATTRKCHAPLSCRVYEKTD